MSDTPPIGEIECPHCGATPLTIDARVVTQTGIGWKFEDLPCPSCGQAHTVEILNDDGGRSMREREHLQRMQAIVQQLHSAISAAHNDGYETVLEVHQDRGSPDLPSLLLSTSKRHR